MSRKSVAAKLQRKAERREGRRKPVQEAEAATTEDVPGGETTEAAPPEAPHGGQPTAEAPIGVQEGGAPITA